MPGEKLIYGARIRNACPYVNFGNGDLEEEERVASGGDLALSEVSAFPGEVFRSAPNRVLGRSAQPVPSESTSQSTRQEATTRVPPSVSPYKTPLPWKNISAAAEF